MRASSSFGAEAGVAVDCGPALPDVSTAGLGAAATIGGDVSGAKNLSAMKPPATAVKAASPSAAHGDHPLGAGADRSMESWSRSSLLSFINASRAVSLSGQLAHE